jgi:mono/diheme cytochrome c family protein
VHALVLNRRSDNRQLIGERAAIEGEGGGVRRSRGSSRLAVVVALGVLAWASYPALRDLVLRSEASDALRGHARAEELGCFGCHGPGGRGGVGNPGSRRETIPGFTGSTLMMYVHDDDEIRQYILDGRPDRLADDPDHAAEMKAQAIHMPAYRDVLEPGDVELLVAYVRQVSGMIEPPGEAERAGAEVALRMGCFGCHGALGMGGVGNPGSLKGYVPGFLGEDYRELVRDEGELREWIAKGRLARVDRHWIGGWFAERQLLQMPAYETRLSAEEMDALVAFVTWLAAGGLAKVPLS